MREYILNGTPHMPAFKDYPEGNESAAIMRKYITSGTPNMLGFKHHSRPDQTDAIVGYVREVPAPAGRSGGHNQGFTPNPYARKGGAHA